MITRVLSNHCDACGNLPLYMGRARLCPFCCIRSGHFPQPPCLSLSQFWHIRHLPKESQSVEFLTCWLSFFILEFGSYLTCPAQVSELKLHFGPWGQTDLAFLSALATEPGNQPPHSDRTTPSKKKNAPLLILYGLPG